MNKTRISIFVAVAIIVVGSIVAFFLIPTGPGVYDDFAQCLDTSGAKFYGTFWCSHCADQKAMFGKSVKLLPYVECSSPSGREQLQVCTDKGIDAYPTWIFADGKKITGVMDLESLASTTGCVLPK